MKYSYVIGRTMLEGLTNAVSKIVLNTLPLFHFLVIRYFIIFIMSFLSVDKLREDMRLIAIDKKIRNNLILGSLTTVLVVVTYYKSMAYLPVSIIGAINYAIYISVTAILGAVMFKEKKSNNFYMLMVLLIPASLLIIAAGNLFSNELTLIGLAFLIVSSVGSAFEAHFSKRQVDELTIAGGNAMKMGLALIVIVILAIMDGTSIVYSITNLTLPLIAMLVLTGISSFIRSLLTLRSIREIGVSSTAVFTCLSPVFGIIAAMIILGETMTILQWIGVVVIVVILYFIAVDEEKK